MKKHILRINRFNLATIYKDASLKSLINDANVIKSIIDEAELAKEIAIRSLLHATEDVEILNVTGPETVSVKDAAYKLGKLLGKEPTFEGEETNMAYLSNASKAISIFGYPKFNINTLIEMQVDWILSEGRLLNKPTHFEERKGSY